MSKDKGGAQPPLEFEGVAADAAATGAAAEAE